MSFNDDIRFILISYFVNKIKNLIASFLYFYKNNTLHFFEDLFHRQNYKNQSAYLSNLCNAIFHKMIILRTIWKLVLCIDILVIRIPLVDLLQQKIRFFVSTSSSLHEFHFLSCMNGFISQDCQPSNKVS